MYDEDEKRSPVKEVLSRAFCSAQKPPEADTARFAALLDEIRKSDREDRRPATR